MSFCKHCGNKIKPFHKCNCEVAQKEREQKESKLAVIIGVSVVGIIAVVLLFVFGVFNTKINAFDYLEVNFDGSNGYGTASISFDKEKLISKVIGKAPSEHNFEESLKWQVKYEEYSSEISYACDKTEGVSNGDTVVVTVTVEGAAASKIKGGSKKFEVENLPQVEVVDIFKDLKVTITGVSGKGTVRFSNPSELPIIKDCIFSADETFGLKNGDEITITASWQNNIEAYQMVPASTTKKYVVEGLPELMTAKDVSKDKIADIKTNFETNAVIQIEKEEECKYKNLSYVGTYFYTPDSSPYVISSKLIAIYSADQHDENGRFEEKVYLSAKYTGDFSYNEQNYRTLVVFADGSNNIAHQELDIDVDNESLNEVLEGHRRRYFSEPYTYEKID